MNVENYLPKGVKSIFIAINDISRFESKLTKMGFSNPFNVGETVLPSKVFGPINFYNAEGKFEKLKDLPKETAYRTIEWHWEQWCGRGQTQTMWDFTDVPYKRYQRKFLPPPSVELSLIQDETGSFLIISPEFLNVEENHSSIKHTINLFLEIFGECLILDESMRLPQVPLKRLNWEILPPGKYPWAIYKSILAPMIEKQPKRKQRFVWRRFETIEAMQPDFKARGVGGFGNYHVFGFESKGIFIVESPSLGNATYIFGHDWEVLTRMTKAEVLNSNSHLGRVIHNANWEVQMSTFLSNLAA
jgi:hypothetical protein